MAGLFNRAKMSVSGTPGTGTITLGAVVSAAFFTFAEAGVPNGTVVSYVIEDGTNVEIGIGTYTSSGTTLSRDTVTASKIAGVAGTTKVTLTSAAVVYIDALAADIAGDIRPLIFKDINNPSVSYTIYSDDIAGDERLIIKSTGWSHRLWLDTDDSTSAFSIAIGGVEQFAFGAGFSTDLVSFLLTAPATNFGIINSGFNTIFLIDQANVRLGIGTDTPQRTLHALQESAVTNGVIPVGRFSATSSGTPANGIGASLEFDVETTVGNNEIGATIVAVASDVTASSEDFDFIIKTMAGGAAAAERFRINSISADFTGIITTSKQVHVSTGSLFNPSSTPDAAAFTLDGLYGGGITFLDSPGRMSMWTEDYGASFFMGFGTSSGVTGYFKYSAAALAILANTSSTDTISGALTVAGGAGIAENLNVGGKITATVDDAPTNAVTYIQRLGVLSGGTPAAGIGAGQEFQVQTAAGNNEIGATIEAVATDVTAASEDFDFIIKTMAGGTAAAERFRINNTNAYFTGNIQVPTGQAINIDGDVGTGGFYLNGVLLISQGSGYRGFKDSDAVERMLFYPSIADAVNEYKATTHVFQNYASTVTFVGIDSSGLGVFGKIFAELDSAATNTVSYAGLLTSTSSGTPAAGIGVGLQLEVETAAGNKEIGATVEAVTTDVTAASEDFDLVFKTMAAGTPAAEALRISSSWEYLGVPKTLSKNFIVRTDYEHIVQKRLTMAGSLRATLQGTANLILTDDMGSRSRIVLAGRG